MSTTLTFLGTSGSTVTESRACAGILLEDKLLDVGFGVVSNLLKLENQMEEVREVYVTHTHSDHIGDFTGLIWAMAIRGRTKALRVIGSTSTCRSLKRILELQSTPTRGFVKFEIQFATPKKMNVPCAMTVHVPDNLAYRFKLDGNEIVYTGDTARSKPVSSFSERADILIHDATYLSTQSALAKLTNHSTAKDAGLVARDAQVGELVLTHISPLNNEHSDRAYANEARTVYGGKVSVASDMSKLEVK